MFAFGDTKPRRKPSLTPMIDVVFLLLVFFMLASRFGMDMQVPLNAPGAGAEQPYSGPPRLVDILPEELRLNGQEIARDALPAALADLVGDPEDTIVLRARDEARLQRVVDVMQALKQAGFTALVLVE